MQQLRPVAVGENFYAPQNIGSLRVLSYLYSEEDELEMVTELSVSQLRRTCDPNFMKCKSTEDIAPLQEIIGQERAIRALRFGLGIKDKGFNIYVAGYPGTGRTTAVKNFLEEIAKSRPTPSDWCYVNNFNNEYGPKAIKLPSGKGKGFQKDMKEFVESSKH